MSAISPTLTASSSTTAYQSSSSSQNTYSDQQEDIAMDKLADFSELFDFDHFGSSESSHTHSPNTISPNHTPSPLPVTGASPLAFEPSYDFLSQGVDMDYNLDYLLTEKRQPEPVSQNNDVVIKQEPVEFGFPVDPSTSVSPALAAAVPVPALQPAAAAMDVTSAAVHNDFTGLPQDQQVALQQLFANILNYQEQFGLNFPAGDATTINQPAQQEASAAPAQTGTIQPSIIFSTPASSAQASSSAPSATMTPAVVQQQAAPAPAKNEEIVHMDHDDDVLVSVEPHERQQQKARHVRESSTPFDDLDSRIDSLVPLPTIFSAGRGKGGKKGGGMSSVVRGDDEDLDDDESWRPSPEEYKKLSSKEKRQLRNKLSARAFRNRRKDYIGQLESHIKDRDTVIDAIRAELVNSRSENQDLRRELEALKTSTMSILHPETAHTKSESPAMLSALAMSPSLAHAAGINLPPRRAPTPTPKYNPRKDLPSSPAMYDSRGYFGNNNDLLGGGSTTCHTMFTPDIVLPEAKEANAAPSRLRGLADLPRVNLNPRLNDETPRMPPLSNTGNAKDLNGSFSDWSEANPFTLRSMDSYRIQMWSRLAREAAAEKTHMATDIRPKFYVESAYVQAANTHISSKLATSFWSAFSGPSSSKLDTDKLAAVVTGKARLKVVDIEKEHDEAELLAAALSGLKLQSGISRTESQILRVRENPLGALSSFFRCPGHCAKA